MVAQTPKCQAKNALICRDPRCPEKRFNLAYTLSSMKAAKKKIEELKSSGNYKGEEKAAADFAYISSMEWHNELLADSRITSADAAAWKAETEKRLNKLMLQKSEKAAALKTIKEPAAKKKAREQITEIDLKIADTLVEAKEAEDNYNSTWEGQERLEALIKASTDATEKKELEKQQAEGAALHAKQIIAMALVDQKRTQSDLPIQVGNAIDLKVLSKEEQSEYAEWIDAVRFDNKTQVTNRDLIMKQTFTSIYKRVNDGKTETEWRIRPRPNHKGWRIPAFVSRALYVMPNSTERIPIIKWKLDKAYEELKASKKQNDRNSSEYKTWAELKYDVETIKRFIK